MRLIDPDYNKLTSEDKAQYLALIFLMEEIASMKNGWSRVIRKKKKDYKRLLREGVRQMHTLGLLGGFRSQGLRDRIIRDFGTLYRETAAA